MSARNLPSPEPLVAEARRLRPPFRAIAISAAKGPNRIPKEAGACRKNEAECAEPRAVPNRDQANGRLSQAEARSQSPHSSIQHNGPQQPATATGHSSWAGPKRDSGRGGIWSRPYPDGEGKVYRFAGPVPPTVTSVQWLRYKHLYCHWGAGLFLSHFIRGLQQTDHHHHRKKREFQRLCQLLLLGRVWKELLRRTPGSAGSTGTPACSPIVALTSMNWRRSLSLRRRRTCFATWRCPASRRSASLLLNWRRPRCWTSALWICCVAFRH